MYEDKNINIFLYSKVLKRYFICTYFPLLEKNENKCFCWNNNIGIIFLLLLSICLRDYISSFAFINAIIDVYFVHYVCNIRL